MGGLYSRGFEGFVRHGLIHASFAAGRWDLSACRGNNRIFIRYAIFVEPRKSRALQSSATVAQGVPKRHRIRED